MEMYVLGVFKRLPLHNAFLNSFIPLESIGEGMCVHCSAKHLLAVRLSLCWTGHCGSEAALPPCFRASCLAVADAWAFLMEKCKEKAMQPEAPVKTALVPVFVFPQKLISMNLVIRVIML